MNNEQLQNEILKEQLRQLKQDNSKKPSLAIYVLLALFLGGIGAHRFYTGKYFTAGIYLLLCATGISVVLSIIDIIIAVINRRNFN